MALHGVICDVQPRCLKGGPPGHSVLMLPLGWRYLINHIVDAFRAVGCTKIIVVTAFEPDDAYDSRLMEAVPRAPLEIVHPEHRANLFLNGEPSDSILLLDARFWPDGGYDFAKLLARHQEEFSAVFAAATPEAPAGPVERVILDTGGNVQRVNRHYERSSWSQSQARIAPCGVLPHGLAAEAVQFPLAVMRQKLAACGIPICDLPVKGPVFDLRQADAMLRLAHQQAIKDALSPSSRYVRSPDHDSVFLGPRASIARAARCLGTVVVNADVHVPAGATLIGPVVIGRAAGIGAAATVAHAVIMDRAVVEPRASVYQEVYTGAMPPPDGEPELDEVCVPFPEGESFSIIGGDGRRVQAPPAERRWTLNCKRALDLAASSLSLILLSPLFLLVAAFVKLTSPGPVLFVHRREGKDGREFGCVKFRTMRTGAHDLQKVLAEANEADGPQFVIRNDPRVTRLGQFLRKSNIDELPQLWNVLKGEMSLVGPRPSPFRENQICAPWRRARLSVRPGITGLWQICRHDRDEGDFHQWIFYDTAYVRHMSMWLDIKILWYTVLTLIRRDCVPVDRVISRAVRPAAGVAHQKTDRRPAGVAGIT